VWHICETCWAIHTATLLSLRQLHGTLEAVNAQPTKPNNVMTHKPILPPRFFVAAAIVSIVLHVAFPVVSLISYPFTLIGIIPIAFGSVLNLWADQLFKKRSTTVKPFERPTALVVEGPFAWSRHPMYLGMVAILVGISILCGSLTSFFGPLAFWIIVRSRFVRAEEQSMTEVFGTQYDDYRRRVHSWI
jgi:protein-S-isoprenylcysteine O-methyltransferase Ste14